MANNRTNTRRWAKGEKGAVAKSFRIMVDFNRDNFDNESMDKLSKLFGWSNLGEKKPNATSAVPLAPATEPSSSKPPSET